MNTTTKLVTLIVLFSISIGAKSQTENKSKEPQVVMYANVGMKSLAFKNLYDKLDALGMPYPKNAFNLGAGAYYNSKNTIYGLDFYYSNASAENDAYRTKYSGFTNSVFAGYKVVNKSSFILAPIVGFSMATNSISMYDRAFSTDILTSSNGYTLTNNASLARVGLTFETITNNGLSIGLTSGYDFSLAGETDWKIEGTDKLSGIQDNQGGFFINLIIGGHIFLKSSK